jgi:iron-only hydrogenase group A
VVEVEGREDLVTACDHVVEPGMVIHTASAKVTARRREVVSFLFAQHPRECLVCERRAYCELKRLGDELGVRTRRLAVTRRRLAVDRTSLAIVRDPNKCVMCGRCVAACMKMHGATPYPSLATEVDGARSAVERAGPRAILGEDWVECRALAFEDMACDTTCVECGQCVAVCPTGALAEKSQLVRVRRWLANHRVVTVAQTAPALRATIAEAWGKPAGTVSTGLMVAVLRKLGFDKVFDTALGADLTAVEEAHELRQRLETGGKVPMFTSCCPAWVKFVENEYPSLVSHLSTCKSPHMMTGAVAKTVLQETDGAAPEDVHVVSLMPCTAKKFEAMTERSARGVLRDVDSVLTTRELVRLIQAAEMDVESLEESGFDAPLGSASGAGTIFGATGGVAEAALRALADELGVELEVGLEDGSAIGRLPGPGVIAATVTLGRLILRVAVIQGLAEARNVLDDVAAGKRPYDFVEVMACPGGCVGGGGQPIAVEREDGDCMLAQMRGAALRAIDGATTERNPRRNPVVVEIYRRFLGEPGGPRAKELLHDPVRLGAQTLRAGSGRGPRASARLGANDGGTSAVGRARGGAR